MFSNLSIRNRVVIVALIGLICFSGYFLLSFLNNQKYDEIFQHVQESSLPAFETVDDINLKIHAIEQIAASELSEKDLVQLKVYGLELTELYKQLGTMDPENSDVIENLEFLTSDYVSNLIFVSEAKLGLLQFGGMEDIDAQTRDLAAELKQTKDDYRTKSYRALQYQVISSQRLRARFLTQGNVFVFLLIASMITAVWFFAKGISESLASVAQTADKIAEGDWHVQIEEKSSDEVGRVFTAMEKMREAIRSRSLKDNLKEEEQTRMASLVDATRGDILTLELYQKIIRHIAPMLNAQVGALYIVEDDLFKLKASFAYTNRKGISDTFKLGEGIVGQVGIERTQVMLSEVPSDYIAITSSLGESKPRYIIVTPIIYDDHLYGVLELGFINKPAPEDSFFLLSASEGLAQSIGSSQARENMSEMLNKTRVQAEELESQKLVLKTANEDLEEQAMELAASEHRLQTQQEELRVTNEELEGQAEALKASEERLQAQQEELRVTNEELEEHARALEGQKQSVEQKNELLENSKRQLQDKTEALELSSKYKSEFLSTMSHELRTPLNSILILSGNLAENKGDHLTEKQIEHANVINKAGTDLLDLINDILDLSKVESGKLEMHVEEVEFSSWAKEIGQLFTPVSEDKGLEFNIKVSEELPAVFTSDKKRLNQIIKNLISNALKFTESGSVGVTVGPVAADEEFLFIEEPVEKLMAFSVFDTGIGIKKESQKLIFEAFQQSDGAISRQFGGTGLGLTISNQLARFLGGELKVSSEGEGCGSCFTLYVPKEASDTVLSSEATMELFGKLDVNAEISDIVDDSEFEKEGLALEAMRASIAPMKDIDHILIIEDDPAFAVALSDLAEEYGLKTTVANDGEEGLAQAKKLLPGGIILDVMLPGMNGWEVMEGLQNDPQTKDIPVHFMSGTEEKEKAIASGAIDFLKKPANKNEINDVFKKIEMSIQLDVKHLLLIEDKQEEFSTIESLFSEKGVLVTIAKSGMEAFKVLEKDSFDCVILDLELPDMNGFAFLEKVQEGSLTKGAPVIIYTGQELERDEEALLRKYADRIILKSGQYAERLISEASLFLHWLESKQSQNQTKLVDHRDDLFEGKKVLIVDDDMRNVYSLSSELEGLGFEISAADSGVECLRVLESGESDADIVLMDIMMPELDGFSTIEQIRANTKFADLPIIVLTAKTLKEDRVRCMELGANDYLLKPIDVERLVALMRVWLTQ